MARASQLTPETMRGGNCNMADIRGWAYRWAAAAAALLAAAWTGHASAWDPVTVTADPLLRMPGSQPGDATLESANRCGNCHEDPSLNLAIESDTRGSMMSHALRDPLFWATMTVAALQTQARQIEVLQAELAALRAQMGGGAPVCR